MTTPDPHPGCSGPEEFVPEEYAPQFLDPQIISAPLVNVVLFTRTPRLEEIIAELSTQFGEDLGEFQVDEQNNAVAVEVYDDHLIHVTVIDEAPDGEAYQLRYHPILTGEGTALDEVCAQAVVAILPSEDRLQLNKKLIAPRIGSAIIHAVTTEAITSVESAVLVHSSLAEATFNAGHYRYFVQEDRLEEVLASIWIFQAEVTDQPTNPQPTDSQLTPPSNAYTAGLAPLGHPELIFRNTTIDPNELYEKLVNLVNYILNGGVLRAKDTLGFADDQILRVSEVSHPYAPEVPCVELQVTSPGA
ncbi:DUF4261 domain-containing protein [Corynebacterium resistens]